MTEPARLIPSLYQEFLAEREEILRHKWLLSEAAGRDVGFDVALIEWTLDHRSEWKTKRAAQKKPENN